MAEKTPIRSVVRSTEAAVEQGLQ